MSNLYVLSSSWSTIILNKLAYIANKHNFSNTTNNITLNKVFIFIFIFLLIIITSFFYHRLRALMNNNDWYFRFSWLFFQLSYFVIGFINCFGFKPVHKCITVQIYKNAIYIIKFTKHYSSPIYAHTHDLFFLTLLYIIVNLFLLYRFNNNININRTEQLTYQDIPDIIEMMALIIAIIGITLDHHISSVSCMGILIIVSISVQLGLFGLYPNFINNSNNNNNNDDNDNNMIITQQNNMTIMQQQNNN